MKYNFAEFDRAHFMTFKSRSAKITPKENSGFTLIELLVVISIIALLSTIVLGALAESKQKGRNSAKNSSIQQYINALELYRDSNTSYPVFGDGSVSPNTNVFTCLGYSPTTESCFGYLSIDGDSTINSVLSPYFGNTIPKDNVSINISGLGDFKGVIYACKNSSDCNSYVLMWHIEGINQQCGIGSVSAPNFGGTTRCSYSSR